MALDFDCILLNYYSYWAYKGVGSNCKELKERKNFREMEAIKWINSNISAKAIKINDPIALEGKSNMETIWIQLEECEFRMKMITQGLANN